MVKQKGRDRLRKRFKTQGEIKRKETLATNTEEEERVKVRGM